MQDRRISIHALLAESDHNMKVRVICTSIFLSTLSLRRATHYDNYNLHCVEISIHALLAESDGGSVAGNWRPAIFLSTLSLRRATALGLLGWLRVLISIHALLAESDMIHPRLCDVRLNFYPRSPCGERRPLIFSVQPRKTISIHALLAESDHYDNYNLHCLEISIHALLAESDRARQQQC